MATKFTAPNWPDFTPTRWDTADDKAKAATALLRFVHNGCPRTQFTKRIHNALHLHLFGHIAEYSLDGFYGAWFATPTRRLAWLRYVADGGAYGLRGGDPGHTWCDVERAVAYELGQRGYLEQVAAVVAAEVEHAERAELARLTVKYGATPAREG